jgi:hypothetical protein
MSTDKLAGAVAGADAKGPDKAKPRATASAELELKRINLP